MQMILITAMPIYGKTFKNLLWKCVTYSLETWYVALEPQCLQSLNKWWPWVDLDLFYVKISFASIGNIYGKQVILRDIMTP